MAPSEWTVPVATFLLGQLSLFLLEWFRHWLTRRQRHNDAHDDFQRQTLLTLQESLYQLVRALSHAKLDSERDRAGQPPIDWPPQEDPRIIGAGVLARIALLTARVNDTEARDLVRQYLGKYDEMFSTSERSDEQGSTSQLDDLFDDLLDDLWKLQGKANDRIGILLRSL